MKKLAENLLAIAVAIGVLFPDQRIAGDGVERGKIAGFEGPQMEELAAQSAPEGTATDVETGQKVPNFRGKTMRAVVEEAAALGLLVSLDGRGTARAQYPSPGSLLHEGERVRVQFAR